jgi:ribosomal protein S18 acetylase RimI-like enzyme
MALANLKIDSFRPRQDPVMPLTPKQAEQLAALHEILDHGDGTLRVASIGTQMVAHVFVLMRITPVSAPLVSAWNPDRPGLAERLHATHSAYVTDVLVKEGYRRLGIASALCHDAAQLARDAGLTRVVLHVKLDNSAAMRLYEGLRFVRSAELTAETVEYALAL